MLKIGAMTAPVKKKKKKKMKKQLNTDVSKMEN